MRYPWLAPPLCGLARRVLLAVAAVQGALAAGLTRLGLVRAGDVVRARSLKLRGIAGWILGIFPWLERHRRFVARAGQGGVDVLFVGDSLTENWLTDGAVPWQERLAPLGAENFGIGGDRTWLVASRLACGELEGIRPRVVVLLIGANDVRANSPEQVAEGIADIIGVIRDRLPSTRTLLLSLLPQDRYETERRASIARVNELIRELHDGEHVIFLEVSGEFLSANGQVSEEIMSDFLHLTPRGYEIFADAIHPVLVDLLAGAEQR